MLILDDSDLLLITVIVQRPSFETWIFRYDQEYIILCIEYL